MESIMKQFYSILFSLAVTLLSCGGGVDDPYIPVNPAISSSLTSLYPNATDVTWSKKGNYEVADCWVDGNELHVWFNTKATWVLTEQAIFRVDLPAPVEDAFSNGPYANYVLDSQTKMTLPPQVVKYLLEVQSGDKEYALLYQLDGALELDTLITNANQGYWPDILGI